MNNKVQKHTIQERQSFNPKKIVKELDGLVNQVSNWDDYEAWAQSKHREQFYDIVSRIQEYHKTKKNKQTQQQQHQGDEKEQESFQSTEHDKNIQQQNTSESVQLPLDVQQQMNEVRQKALKIEKKLFNEVPLSIVCLRRKFFQPLTTIQIDGKQYHILDEANQVSYMLLYDIFKRASYNVFCSYKYLLMTSDMKWINNNPTVPRKFKFLNENIFKRLIVDFYVLIQKYSCRQILQVYDIQFILDAYQRAVMIAKGSTSPHLQNFQQAVSLQDWLQHHERTCEIKGELNGDIETSTELSMDLHGFMLKVRMLRGKFLVQKQN